jgi:hypothetical protein
VTLAVQCLAGATECDGSDPGLWVFEPDPARSYALTLPLTCAERFRIRSPGGRRRLSLICMVPVSWLEVWWALNSTDVRSLALPTP